MSATDEQRRLLDELRKLACDINENEIRSHSVITLNQGRYNMQFRLDMNHDWLNAWHAELERILQAIDATLGPRTCKLPETRIDHGQIEYNGVTEWRKCSACGAEILAYPAHFCPNCGRKVVAE